MKKGAFVCIHNSCRSQIAEALCKYYGAVNSFVNLLLFQYKVGNCFTIHHGAGQILIFQKQKSNIT